MKTQSFIYAAAFVIAGLGDVLAQSPTTLLNVSYDVSRELFAQINPAFAKVWKEKSGEAAEISQSHGGSSSQARAILEGLQADVVTFNQVTDVQVLADKGKLVAPDWQSKFPNKASPFYSLPAFLVRKGNPKGLKDWDDLVKDGVQIVFPNPKTSGNGRYTYLAATAFALNKFGGDKAKAKEFVAKLFANVAVFDTGGRAATTTFAEREIGDVLITFEAEAYGSRKQFGEDKFEVVTPSLSLLAEFPVAIVDAIAEKRRSRALATAYLNFLYAPEAQDILGKNFYRVHETETVKKYAAQFPPVKLVTAEETFGGWAQVTKEHFGENGLLDQVLVKR